jgi:Glycosyltransferase family 87
VASESCDAVTVAAAPSWHRRLGEQVTADRLVLGLAFVLLALIAVRWHNYQWDFYMFVGSADDFLHGISPYRGKGLSFYHPPLTLYLYSLFVRLPFPLAYELWLSLKVLALGGLFFLWRRHFLKLGLTWGTTVYFVLAYNGTIYSDFVSGNVSTFEQFGLWLAFAALLQGRYARFCVCLALVAQFKLTPIFFSVLLLVAPAKAQWKWFAVCGAEFAGLLSLNYALQPTLLRDFFSVAPALDERGTLAPGTLAFVRDVFDRLAGAHFTDGTRADELIFAIAALTVGALSLAAVVRHRRAATEPDPKLIIYFACLAYALLVPRMRVYSHILLLIPTLHLLRALPRRTLVPAATVVLAAMVIFPNGNSLLPFRALSAATFAVWVGFHGILLRERDPNAESVRVAGNVAF